MDASMTLDAIKQGHASVYLTSQAKREANRRWKEKNAEKVREASRECAKRYYREHREEILAKKRAIREERLKRLEEEDVTHVPILSDGEDSGNSTEEAF